MSMSPLDIYKDERCECGKKGDYVKSNGYGVMIGFLCKECYEKTKQDQQKND